MLKEVEIFVPALTLSVTKCYETRPAYVFFRMHSGETRMIVCSSAVSGNGTPWDEQYSARRFDRG